MNNVMQGIELTLQEYRDCWSRLDFSGLRSLWDPAEAEPTYLAEEHAAALFNWQGIEAYWEATRQATRSIRLETWNLRTRLIADDLATAVYDMRWLGEFAGYDGPIGGDTRVTAIFRRRAGQWRFIHYVEAPLAPIVYFRKSYERFGQAPPPRG
jgi:hypothetical protein